jgi:inositol transport system ATP-binding protein
MHEYILQVSNLSKSFSGIKALDNVQLSLKAGEVHALMGENGAGKSTFMKILVGLLAPDEGEFVFNGEPLRKRSGTSLRSGIAMIHQELLVIPELTVAQNIFLGREKEGNGVRNGWLTNNAMNLKAQAVLDRMGVEIAAKAKIKNLSVAQMQMVEIAKAISNEAKVIIMDEPTSAISDKEVTTLFGIISSLKKRGVAVIYISHKMDEIFEISDTVTVLRDGKHIGTYQAAELDQQKLIALMVGREIASMFPEPSGKRGEVILEVRNLAKKNKFSGIDFKVHRGEILGISGLMGAGRTEIARTIFGLDQPDEGEIILNGKFIRLRSSHDAISHGIGYVSEDRKGQGFVPDMTISANLTLSSLSKHRKGIFVDSASETVASENMAANLRIKSSGLRQKVKNLSGGNQQKVVIGKVLLSTPQVIILDEPTRGVDVGAKFEIYKLMRQLSEQGIAIIMISSELPEILGMSDRVMVLCKGKQTAMLSRQEATQELIMKFAVE